MFVPMWVVWVAAACVVVPPLFRWLVGLSFAAEQRAGAAREAAAATQSMDHARWPKGDPRGMPPVIAAPAGEEGPAAKPCLD